VFLAVDGRARQTKISLRELDARRVEIIDGLKPEDHVLAGPNLMRVRDGDPVSVEIANVD